MTMFYVSVVMLNKNKNYLSFSSYGKLLVNNLLHQVWGTRESPANQSEGSVTG